LHIRNYHLKEYETSAFVKKRLDETGIHWQPMAGTGIVAMIKGDKAIQPCHCFTG
jgi:metal-dependent amidase/aminoacylase/carboxypeptidase family protein